MAEKVKNKSKSTKVAEILELLPNSKLIADSGYSAVQWEKIVDVIPEDYLDELYGFLRLEQKLK